jgi:RNA polymerase sigma-70 factor, ECF subfamily
MIQNNENLWIGDRISWFQNRLDWYEQRLKAYCRKLVVNSDVADDIVQDTFIAAFESIDKLMVRPESEVRGWLFVVVRHKAAKHIRTICRRKEVSLQEFDRESKDLGPQETSERKELVEKILNELCALDPLIFQLIYVEELSPAEAAEVLNLQPATFRKRLQRLVSRLREMLGRPATSRRTKKDKLSMGSEQASE